MGQHHGPWGITESGVTNRKAGRGQVGKKNDRGRNQRERRKKPMETDRRGWGRRGSSSGCPVSVLTLWTPACRCRCEQSRGQLPGHTRPRGRPAGPQGAGAGTPRARARVKPWSGAQGADEPPAWPPGKSWAPEQPGQGVARWRWAARRPPQERMRGPRAAAVGPWLQPGHRARPGSHPPTREA